MYVTNLSNYAIIVEIPILNSEIMNVPFIHIINNDALLQLYVMFQGRTWSEDSCQCGCPVSTLVECDLGMVFDFNSTCSCVPALGSATHHAKEQTEVVGVVKEEEPILGWEMILIISLGSLLIILSLIVLGLLIRLRSLRRKAESQQSLVPSTLSGQYFPCSDPCTDLSAPTAKKLINSSLSDSDSDRGKMLTDSSLCSEQEPGQWTDSSESLHHAQHGTLKQGIHCGAKSPCLESVNLNSNLAIRCNDNYSIYSGGKNEDYNTIYNGSTAGKSETYSNYSSIKNGNQSNYNTVKIVYTHGDRSTELTCLMDPSQTENNCVNTQYNITTNPMNMYSM